MSFSRSHLSISLFLFTGLLLSSCKASCIADRNDEVVNLGKTMWPEFALHHADDVSTEVFGEDVGWVYLHSGRFGEALGFFSSDRCSNKTFCPIGEARAALALADIYRYLSKTEKLVLKDIDYTKPDVCNLSTKANRVTCHKELEDFLEEEKWPSLIDVSSIYYLWAATILSNLAEPSKTTTSMKDYACEHFQIDNEVCKVRSSRSLSDNEYNIFVPLIFSRWMNVDDVHKRLVQDSEEFTAEFFTRNLRLAAETRRNKKKKYREIHRDMADNLSLGDYEADGIVEYVALAYAKQASWGEAFSTLQLIGWVDPVILSQRIYYAIEAKRPSLARVALLELKDKDFSGTFSTRQAIDRLDAELRMGEKWSGNGHGGE